MCVYALIDRQAVFAGGEVRRAFASGGEKRVSVRRFVRELRNYIG